MSIDKPKVLRRDCIYNIELVLEILFTFYLYRSLPHTNVPARPANVTHSASVFWNGKICRSLLRGHSIYAAVQSVTVFRSNL